ncbi:hypothetical protein O181_023314 [Austropuccinia psidii MF-1]|uniref:Uncharacterized protein n=1 Tax=Austropuccinia psidii MF-1 TaxID=1389203 RepID=A0A9Q3CE63_9BASI|nr:hypothetical protein [Austropuccinia psidii MF-1]
MPVSYQESSTHPIQPPPEIQPKNFGASPHQRSWADPLDFNPPFGTRPMPSTNLPTGRAPAGQQNPGSQGSKLVHDWAWSSFSVGLGAGCVGFPTQLLESLKFCLISPILIDPRHFG